MNNYKNWTTTTILRIFSRSYLLGLINCLNLRFGSCYEDLEKKKKNKVKFITRKLKIHNFWMKFEEKIIFFLEFEQRLSVFTKYYCDNGDICSSLCECIIWIMHYAIVIVWQIECFHQFFIFLCKIVLMI